MKYFGTDGIRGKVGEDVITPEFALRIGWALGKLLTAKASTNTRIIIGKDTRNSGFMLECAIIAGLTATGCTVILAGVIPTPAVAFLIKAKKAKAGIVISASHNLYQDNGIKIFDHKGEKISPATELQIEQQLQHQMMTIDVTKLSQALYYEESKVEYAKYCLATVPNLKLNGLKIALDTANGAYSEIAPKLFSDMSADLRVMANKPDGTNINKNCGSTAIQALRKLVINSNADLGIAFDGDGDRVILVDHQGNIVDGDKILYIIASDWQQKGILSGGVVGTVMTNMGVELALKTQGIKLIRTAVGDKYVDQELNKRNWILGGESSGHILCKNLATTGDGILVALQVLSIIQTKQLNLAELVSPIEMFPQKLINIKISKNFNLANNNKINTAIVDIQEKLANSGRVLVRKSGTEPIVRIMIEDKSTKTVDSCVQYLADIIKKEVAY